MTDFEKSVRIALILRDKRFGWLCAEVAKETGMFCDASRLLKVISGKQSSPRIYNAVKEILGIREGRKWKQM